MIELSDVYKVVVAMVPLYVALMLGYGSVKWWHMFTPEQSDAINRMNCYFILPLFTFEFTTHMNPYKMNYLFITADVISKCLIGLMLGIWIFFCKGSTYEWCITGFSMSSINNTLIVGVPLMSAMYGSLGEELVIQSAVLQSIIWIMILLFMLEVRRARLDFETMTTHVSSSIHDHQMSSTKDLELGGNINIINNTTSSSSSVPAEIDSSLSSDHDVVKPPTSFWLLMKTVLAKLAKNPNCYACIVGLIWAFLSTKWNFEMPSIMEGSILIMSKAGTGTSMFCMGLFMASHKKLIACGAKATVLGMILRFIVGPFSVGIACLAVGLRGDVLRIAIVQAALPQAVASFIYAKEYGLHADVISTGVIFGTVVSLPILIAYFAVLDMIPMST